jgi:hypothetical protein
MSYPPTWAFAVSQFFAYHSLSAWHPDKRLGFTQSEPLPQRIERLRGAWQASASSRPETIGRLLRVVTDTAPHITAKADALFLDLAIAIAVDNDVYLRFPEIDLTHTRTSAEAAALVAQLVELETRITREAEIHAEFARVIATLLETIIPHHLEDQDGFKIPLFAVVGASEFVEVVLAHALDVLSPPSQTADLAFRATRIQLWSNLAAVSRLTPEQLIEQPQRIVPPRDSTLKGEELVQHYLAGTPFLDLACHPVPFVIPRERRFEHCHIIGGTGHGKTQLLQSLALANFDDPDRPGVVIIDSQGDMLAKLSRLARFDPALDDRLLIVDPADTEFPLCLNVFDINQARLATLSLGEREQILAGIIELYDYLFGAISAELTQKQAVIFRYLARLMLDIPGANIQTLRELMENASPFESYIRQLTGTTRAFFDNEFSDRSFTATKQQIRRRLYGILSNPTFERIFSHPRNKLDIRTALDTGKIVLVNTAQDVLKAEASSFFGRYIIALVMQAVFERAAQPESQRRPAFLYIDEAADYFDDNIDALLIQARKYKLGVTLAHQFLDQLTPALRASMMTNPAIRFAGGVSQKDANALDADMRTTSHMLMATRKRDASTEFACYVRNLTPSAVTLQVPLGVAEAEPRMTASAWTNLRQRSRALLAEPLRLSQPSTEPVVSVAQPAPAPQPDARPLKDPSKPTDGW